MSSVVTRACLFLLGAVLLSSFIWHTTATGQPPANEDDATQQAIRDALSGKDTPPGSGDPLLQDVLNLIKGRGSMLDGSALDLETSELLETEKPAPAKADPTSEARAAEALLKAARLLSRLPANEHRSALVNQMRSEAAGCLKKYASP